MLKVQEKNKWDLILIQIRKYQVQFSKNKVKKHYSTNYLNNLFLMRKKIKILFLKRKVDVKDYVNGLNKILKHWIQSQDLLKIKKLE